MAKKMKISACLITKNEEKYIKRCISSFSEVVDEIIVVDTGSEDKTIEIAQNLGAIVYNFKWNNSFSEARNFAIDKVHGQWIIFLDADEYFYGNSAKLLPHVLEQSKDKDGILFKFKDFDEDSGRQIQDSNLIRVFKKSPHIRYQGNIHETIFNNLRKMKLVTTYDTGIEIHHSGYSLKKVKFKAKRNLDLLLNEIDNHNQDKMLLYYLSDCYHILGEYEKAIDYAENFIESKTIPLGYRTKSYHNIIKSMEKLKMPIEKRMERIEDAINKFPEHPDFYKYLGLLLLEQKKYTLALQNLLKTIELNETYNDIEMNTIPSNLDELYMIIGKIYEAKNELVSALEYYIKALSINKFNKTVFDLTMNVIKNENAEDVILLLLKIYDKNNEKDIQYIVDNLKRLKTGKVMVFFGNVWMSKFKQEDSTIMFMLLSAGSYNEAYKLFEQCYELDRSTWVYDHIVILALLTADKVRLTNIGSDDTEYSKIINIYLNKIKNARLNHGEIEGYLKLIEQSILLNEQDLLNSLINLSKSINNNITKKLTQLLMKYGKYIEALNVLLKDMDMEGRGNNKEIFFDIAYCYYKLMDYNISLDYFQKAKSLGYTNQELREYVGWIEEKLFY